MAQYDSLTTRMPNGVTNAAPWQTMGAAGTPDPTWSVMYANDFMTFAAGDWTITKVGTGTTALTNFDGGALLLTNTTGAADAIYMQLATAGFKITPGKALFFKFQAQLSAVNLDVFFCGLAQAGASTIASITDGIYIAKATGQAGLTLNSVVGSVTTTVNFPAVEVLTAATTFEVGFMVDYLGNVAAFFNPTTGSNPISAANAANGQARGRVATLANGASTTPALTTALLAPIFGLLNSSGVANTMTVDFVAASRER